MSSATSEFLVISRGQWDKDASPEKIEAAIDKFYGWLENHVAQGRMKTGSRLKRERADVSRSGIVMDGPFGEGKEVIGGIWFIIARDLREAAELAAGSPCAEYGLSYEVRPLDPERASVYKPANETPSAK
jgi:hypothetical protein